MSTKIIYTDGACKNNPGPGGWAWVEVKDKVEIKSAYGNEDNTTNNRMELLAIINALNSYEVHDELLIYSDSKYVVTGINEWMANWKEKGWFTKGKKLVKNRDLWFEIDNLLSQRTTITIEWVKAHTNTNFGNDLADKYAQAAASEIQEVK